MRTEPAQNGSAILSRYRNAQRPVWHSKNFAGLSSIMWTASGSTKEHQSTCSVTASYGSAWMLPTRRRAFSLYRCRPGAARRSPRWRSHYGTHNTMAQTNHCCDSIHVYHRANRRRIPQRLRIARRACVSRTPHQCRPQPPDTIQSVRHRRLECTGRGHD